MHIYSFFVIAFMPFVVSFQQFLYNIFLVFFFLVVVSEVKPQIIFCIKFGLY